MKRSTWLRGFLLAVLLLVLPVIALAEETAVLQDGPDWEYDIADGVAVVKKYNGTDETVTIPTEAMIDGVRYRIRTIGPMAFQGNETMKTLIVSEGVTSIGMGAFRDCTALETVTVAQSVKSVGNIAFKNCVNLSSLTINGDWDNLSSNSIRAEEFYDGGYKHSYDYSVFYNTGTNVDSFEVTFGPEVTRVPDYLFATSDGKGSNVYSHVTAIHFSDGVTEIGAYAFFRCYDLQELAIGKNVDTVGSWSFAYDDGLTRTVMGENTLTINERAFYGCIRLSDLQLNRKLRTVSDFAFENCYSLENLTIPASVTQLKNGAFKNCTWLSSLVINANLADCNTHSAQAGEFYDGGYKHSHDFSVFHNTGTNADNFSVTFGSGVKRVPAYLFATGCPIEDNVYAHVKTVVFSDTVEEIAPYAFYACYDLDNLALSDNIYTVGNYAFAYDTGMRSAKLGANTQHINPYAFLGCTRLTALDLRDNLETIGTHAFENCTALKTLLIPASVRQLDLCAFKDCSGLSDVTIHANLADFNAHSAQAGEFYDSGYKHCHDCAVFYNTGNSATGMSVTFGSAVTKIPAYIFASGNPKENDQYCHVSTVMIPDSVQEIGAGAFCNCYDLHSVLYTGTEEEWQAVTIGENNGSLTDLRMVFAYTRPTVIPEALQVLDITVRDSSGRLTNGGIPEGTALASIRLKNISNTGDAMVMLAAYTAEGQYKGLCYVSVEEFPAGGIFSVTVPVDNKDGSIAQLKAFTVGSLSDLRPLSSPVVYPAA